MANQTSNELLTALRERQQAQPLSILHLAEPILEHATSNKTDTTPRNNDSSTSNENQLDNSMRNSNSDFENPTPQSLQADLSHYKDLFSKLRFSYLEQVTKEKYLRSIVGDPPLLVSHADNLALEEKLTGMKAELKAKKEEVDNLVRDMEGIAQDLARKYDKAHADMRILETVPKEIEDVQAQVDALKAELAETRRANGEDGTINENPRMNMSLEATRQALEEQMRKNRELDAEIESLQRQMPMKIRECEKVEKELEELERRRNETTRLAREVTKIKEQGGRDLLSEQGRWYKSSDIVLRELLGIEA